jgi:hypothetical protein
MPRSLASGDPATPLKPPMISHTTVPMRPSASGFYPSGLPGPTAGNFVPIRIKKEQSAAAGSAESERAKQQEVSS